METGSTRLLLLHNVQECQIQWSVKYGLRYQTVRFDNVMWCDVMWCDVMWCDVVWCDVMWWQRCDGKDCVQWYWRDFNHKTKLCAVVFIKLSQVSAFYHIQGFWFWSLQYKHITGQSLNTHGYIFAYLQINALQWNMGLACLLCHWDSFCQRNRSLRQSQWQAHSSL